MLHLKIANAKHEAKLTQLKVDFQMSDLTYDSWQILQDALEEEMKNIDLIHDHH